MALQALKIDSILCVHWYLCFDIEIGLGPSAKDLKSDKTFL